MWGQIVAVFQAIKALIDLIKMIRAWQVQREKAEAEKRAQELASAIGESKKADSDDEIWKSQDSIVSNRPKP